jgi:hypothetical protein
VRDAHSNLGTSHRTDWSNLLSFGTTDRRRGRQN